MSDPDLRQPRPRLDTAVGIATAVREGQTTAVERIDTALERIAATDERVHAFVEVQAESARQCAADIDRRRSAGESLGALAGVPIAIKDNFTREGAQSSCGSRILAGFVSPYTSTAVARLEAADAIIIGRTNMDEFGMGSSTEHSAHGPTHNPFDLSRCPGGSSGGSAAAVAARMVPLAIGSDTGGSVRQPAALCGVSGLKPTYGRISRFGLIAYASSLDTVAPLATNAADLALVMSVLAGVDARDSTSIDAPVPQYPNAAQENQLEGLRVGVPAQYFADGLDPEVEAATRSALSQLEELGASLLPIEMPHTRYAISTYYMIAMAEASSNLSRFDGVRFGHRAAASDDLADMYRRSRSEGFGEEVQRRIMLGCYCLRQGYVDEWYVKAQKVRTLIRRDFDAAFERCDLIASATSPIPAFELGEKLDDPLAMFLCDTLTTPANLAGVPGLSIPCGHTEAGLPIGLQLMAGALDEATLLRVAHSYQSVTDHHEREPSL